MKPLLAAVVMAALLPPAALAGTCSSPAEVEASIKVLNPGAAAHHLTGADVPGFLARFNALPPPTDLTADEVEVFAGDRYAGAMVVLFQGGCMRRHISIDGAAVPLLLGDPS